MIGKALAAVGDPAALARIAGPIGEAARAAARELAALGDGAARSQRRAAWIAAARAPVPAGLRGVDASWIEAALAELPARARTAIAGGGGGDARDPLDVWLARWACASFVAMAEPRGARPLREALDVLALDAAALAAWLAAVGADQLARALAIAGADGTARFGEPLRAAMARIDRAPRAGALGPARAVIARCAVGEREDATIALVKIGARAVAPHVARVPLAARAIALRLPRALGLVVEHELRGHAGAAIEAAPAWSAIAE